jgi:signal transduction histidine kinase/ActR/RegA family two-component response regulator
MSKKIKILHLEDSLNDSELIHSIINREGIENEYFLVDTEKDFKNMLETQNIDVILSDYSLPNYSGNEALMVAIENHPTIPFIFISGKMGEDNAINAMVNGATDYVLKDRLERLAPAIIRASHEHELELNREKAEQDLREKNEQIEAQNKKYIEINKELAFQVEVNEKHAAELILANKELAYQNEEKEKRAMELIKAKEHAEESDRLKSAFLANMSHEIRTPMNGILGFADLLKEPNLTGEMQQEYIKIIEKSGRRMLNIINDIVDISKIESGLMEVDIRESNINEQIEYIYTFFSPEVENKGMRFSFKNALPLKESIIYTDREKIFAILTNLVKNAIKFTRNGSIEFGYVLKKENDPKMLEFFVKDTGMGIPIERQKAIFERFIQADISDKMALQGAGLGLSITKAYVEELGGEIWVESEVGKGSVFYFTIPYHAEPEAKVEIFKEVPIAEIEESVENLKILIAEDDETSEILISILVHMFSKEVLKARNGVEAVNICRENPDIDLILMDLQMPEMNGYEATRQIRNFNKEVIIIAQTAFALTWDRKKAIEAGCNDSISKPILKDQLLTLIHKYIVNSN